MIIRLTIYWSRTCSSSGWAGTTAQWPCVIVITNVMISRIMTQLYIVAATVARAVYAVQLSLQPIAATISAVIAATGCSNDQLLTTYIHCVPKTSTF